MPSRRIDSVTASDGLAEAVSQEIRRSHRIEELRVEHPAAIRGEPFCLDENLTAEAADEPRMTRRKNKILMWFRCLSE